ncbi:MAG TPA: hypothetical protein PLD59_04925 [Tepidisphaeraceae bacterium]|nr:hypothetical protein [Tepidisphaeraceae bacterium]
MMQVTVVCDNCQKVYAADAAMAGRRIRCRGCGYIVTIPSANEANDAPDLDSLAAVERSFAGGDAVTQHGATQVQHSPGLPAGMEDVPLSGEGIEQAGRANLRFNFAGSKELDMILPWVLIAGSVVWIFLQSHRTNRSDAGWITFTSAVAWLGVYTGIVSPITFAAIRAAGRAAGFQLPRTARFRSFASFMPAIVLTAALWMLGHGAFASAIMGALGGVLVASCCLWILFRLRPEEVPTAAGLAGAGYLAGVVLSGALLLGLNTLARSIVDSTQTSAVPISPFGAGFKWEPIVKRETEAEAAARRTRTVAAERRDPNAPVVAPVEVITPSGPPPVSNDLASAARGAAVASVNLILPTAAVSDPGPQMQAPTSALVTAFSPATAMRERADQFLYSLTPSPFIVSMRRDGDMLAFTCWDSRTWKRANDTPVRFKATQGTENFVFSPDGTRLARVATFIRREIEIYSFQNPSLQPATIPLNDTSGGMQVLVGFLPNDGAAGAKSDRLLVSSDADGKILVNAYDLERKAPTRTRPLELPSPEGGRNLLALSANGRYFAMVGRHTDRNVPAVRFFSMTAERLVSSHEVQVGDLPSGWPSTPKGFALTADSAAESDTLAAVLFEHMGGAIVYTFKQVPGVKVGEYIDRNGELQSPAGYSGPALMWLGSGKNRALLVYGTTLLDPIRGAVIGQIDLSRMTDARLADLTSVLLLAETDRHPIPARVEIDTASPGR